MAKILLLSLLIGHLLGDFYFQSSKLAVAKDKSFIQLLKHCLIYMVSMIFVIIPIFTVEIFILVLIISLSHLIVDFIKYLLKKKYNFNYKSDLILYIFDQFIHIGFIFIMSYFILYTNEMANRLLLSVFNIEGILSWIFILLLISKPVSVTIKKVLHQYKPIESEENEGYPNAGSLIGILERFIILLFLSVGEYSAIGFVLTAKSIARYNKIAEDPKFSEYYLLGTLLSALLVIVAHLIVF